MEKPKPATVAARSRAARSILPTIRLRILVVGDSSVGKTQLVRRYCNETLSQAEKRSTDYAYTDSSQPTVGVDCVAGPVTLRKDNDGVHDVRSVATFFDFSGHPEHTRVRTDLYTEEYHGLAFVFDVTNRSSFDRLETVWVREVTAASGGQKLNCKQVLLGNKIDAPNMLRVVSKGEAMNWAAARNMQYFEVSAKTAMGVVSAFNALITSCRADSVRHHATFDGDGEGASAPVPPSASASSPSNTASGAPPPFPSSRARAAQSSARPAVPRSVGANDPMPTPVYCCTEDPETLSVAQLKRELAKMGAAHEDCLEKADLVKRFASILPVRLAEKRAVDKLIEERELAQKQERAKDQVQFEMTHWLKAHSNGTDLRGMLNDVHELRPGSDGFLSADSSVADVKKSYKKALLKIHPDKVSVDDLVLHARATEMFKAVNSAFTVFEAAN